MNRPSLFVGASTEGLDVARKVRAQLKYDAEVTLWTDNVFHLNESALDGLFRQLQVSDFAAIVLSADDTTESRKRVFESPRDNTLLELGLFLGHLGRQRTFAVYDADHAPKLPSDLLGITLATYKGNRRDGNLLAAVGEACDVIRDVIGRLGPRTVSMANRVPSPPERPTSKGQRAGGMVWVLGSYGTLKEDQKTMTQRLIGALAAGFVSRGLRVVMAESDLLLEFAHRCREAAVASPDHHNITTVLFGSLRHHDLRSVFTRIVGAQPDIAVLLGGNTSRGRVRQEYDLAVANGIPVLAVAATGGVAAEVSSSAVISEEEREALTLSTDFGDLSRTVVSIVSRYAGPPQGTEEDFAPRKSVGGKAGLGLTRRSNRPR